MKITVNVDKGFLPHFAPEFLASYGKDSLFVRSVSDVLSRRTAQIMKRKGILKNPSAVAIFAPRQASKCVQQLVDRLDHDSLTILYQEALGILPLGSFGLCVDECFGGKIFSPWLSALERTDYAFIKRITHE